MYSHNPSLSPPSSLPGTIRVGRPCFLVLSFPSKVSVQQSQFSRFKKSGMAGVVTTQVPTLVRRAPSAWTLIMQVSILVWRAPTNCMKAYCLQGFWRRYKALIRLSGPYKVSIRFLDAFCARIRVGLPCFSSFLFPSQVSVQQSQFSRFKKSGMAGAVITQVPTLVRRASSAWTLIEQVSILVWRAPTNFMKACCLRGFWMLSLIRLSGPYKGSIMFSHVFCTRIILPRPFLSSLPGTIRVGQPCLSCSFFPSQVSVQQSRCSRFETAVRLH